VFQGPTTQLIVRLPQGDTIQALLTNEDGAVGMAQGTPVAAFLPPDALRVLPA